jgi:hypothetical protein
MNTKDKLECLKFSADMYNEITQTEDIPLSVTTLGLSIDAIASDIKECILNSDFVSAEKQLNRIMIPIYKLAIQIRKEKMNECQKRSMVYGNTKIRNSCITKKDVNDCN